MLPLLWADWRSLTGIDGPEPCAECQALRVRRVERDGIEMVELYSGRVGQVDEAIRARVVELTPDPPPGRAWKFEVDIGRGQSGEESGDHTAIWRGLVAKTEPARRRVLP